MLKEWGSPGRERFGPPSEPMASRFVWLDSPETGPRWELPPVDGPND